jgi:hypothetical protein
MTDATSSRADLDGPHDGLSPAPHKISIDAAIMHHPRSERVRRQGLEPRTRGLREGDVLGVVR